MDGLLRCSTMRMTITQLQMPCLSTLPVLMTTPQQEAMPQSLSSLLDFQC